MRPPDGMDVQQFAARMPGAGVVERAYQWRLPAAPQVMAEAGQRRVVRVRVRQVT